MHAVWLKFIYLYENSYMHIYVCIFGLNLARRILMCFCNDLGPKGARNVQKVRWPQHGSFIFIC